VATGIRRVTPALRGFATTLSTSLCVNREVRSAAAIQTLPLWVKWAPASELDCFVALAPRNDGEGSRSWQ